MEDLINQKILSHDEMKLFDAGQVDDHMQELSDKWESLENPPVMIRARYKFSDFVKAMEFVNKVAVIAEKEGHHPDIVIHYNKVEITLWSHHINGLSLNDFIFASKIDNIL
ncbi:MAG: 4a-hydroxytetrahydrobiopterin dehydratase [Candidatus Staskawiczbacteria bacterium]|nr:4a-hydroxytetrahydrobiopterin dehydratase [Candidatus Staskawiczbacteria bacterium]